MTKKEEIKLLWSTGFGKDSAVNLFGQIVLFPVMVVFFGMITLCILLFEKSRQEEQ